jgi:hypothetical protein
LDIGLLQKRVLKYLKGTQDFALRYSKVDEFNLIRYFDSDFVGDKETGLSTLGYLMSLGSIVVSWRFHNRGRICGSCRSDEGDFGNGHI